MPSDLAPRSPGRALPFALPPPPGEQAMPIWTGATFQVGDRYDRVLSYQVGESGWSAALTDLHEQSSGGDHFIDVASRRQALDQLKRNLVRSDAVILEVGCSAGHFLRDLIGAMPEADIVGSDYIVEAMRALADSVPGVALIQFDLTQCPLPDHAVDAVVALNVLEHIEDHDRAISQVFRILKPGGAFVVEVPAGPELFDDYDRELLHFRRYRMGDLVRRMKRAGFIVRRRSHIGALIYPAFWLSKKLRA
jgi:SAM-dependent methyltransferase